MPAGIERGADAVAPAGRRDRIRMRRRLRELRRLREAQLLELGALVLEAQKHGRDEPPIVKTKAAEAAATDAEARALADALDTDAGLDTIVAEGIAGPCPTCGTLTSTAARFCSTCGTPLDGRPDAAPRTDAEAAPETPLTDARDVDAREADADAHDADARVPEEGEADARLPDAPRATDAETAAADASAEADAPRAADARLPDVPRAADADTAAADAPAEAGAPRAADAGEADADAGDADAPRAADPAGGDAGATDRAGVDAPTTELRPGNGNGASPEEVRTTTGRES